jgi:hypothetical protein
MEQARWVRNTLAPAANRGARTARKKLPGGLQGCLAGSPPRRCGIKFLSVLCFATLLLGGCGAVGPGDTADIQKAVDAGGTVTFSKGTYVLTQTIVVRNSNTVIQGAGPETVFVFQPTLPQVHCVNDRAFTTSCDAGDVPRRQITGPIAAGDDSFTASGDVSDLHFGDWLIIDEKDRMDGDVIDVDWAQVASATGNIVTVQSPFRTAFSNVREWNPDHSGLGFVKVPQLIEGVQFRNFTILVPDSGQNAPGISVFAAQRTLIEGVTAQDANGQALYSYLAKDLMIENSYGHCGQSENEFAATVDLKLNGNTFSADSPLALGLEFGTGFFQVTGNTVPSSVGYGMWILDGVHDGTVTNNTIAFVRSSGNGIGILVRGTQRVDITNNYLAGGAGAASVGISIGPQYYADLPIPSTANTITPNRFGNSWAQDYDPTNAP